MYYMLLEGHFKNDCIRLTYYRYNYYADNSSLTHKPYFTKITLLYNNMYYYLNIQIYFCFM